MDDYHRGLLMQMQRELLEKSSLTHHGLCHLMLCVLAQECSDYHQLPNRLKIVGELHPEWRVFDVAWTASASIAVLSIAAIAFLLGALIAWAAAVPARRRGRAAERRVAELEARITALNASAAQAVADQRALTQS